MAIFNEMLGGGLNAKDCTADASKILDGYTAGVGKVIVEGTMPNNGDVDTAIVNGVLKEGYTAGGQIEGLTAENIRENINIAGIIGKYSGEAKFIDCGTYSGGRTNIVIDNPYGTNINGVVLVGNQWVNTVVASVAVLKQSDGNYLAYNLYTDSYGAPNGYRTKNATISQINNEKHNHIQINSTNITFTYLETDYGTWGFRGYYYAVLW